MKAHAVVRVYSGEGAVVLEGFMTKEVLYIGRAPMAGGFDESCEPKAQFMLLPQVCRGVSKIRHLKIFWRTEGEPSFMAEVVGRCNGAGINGVLYKEGGIVALSETVVSCISVGQSCYMFFAPARRVVVRTLNAHPSCSEEDQPLEPLVPMGDVVLASMDDSTVRRFPKLWSKALIDVFQSLGKNELLQSDLVTEFVRVHSVAVAAYMGSSGCEVEAELWSRDLKRFVTKSPFDFDPVEQVIKFDPTAVKPRRKVPRVADGSDVDTDRV